VNVSLATLVVPMTFDVKDQREESVGMASA
jgi:hypothetical protein